jgi:hypothetical protein
MIITYENYKIFLPEKLHETFCKMAGRNRPIIYKDGILRVANIDEY